MVRMNLTELATEERNQMINRPRKIITVTGLVAALALMVPLASADTTRQDQSQQRQSSVQERGIGQRTASAMQTPKQYKASSDIIGIDIQTADGEKVASVENLYIDMNSGEILAVVTSTGGILGAGGQQSLISTKDVRFDAENKHLRTSLTKEQLQAAPRYRTGERTAFDEVTATGVTTDNRYNPANRGRPHSQDMLDGRHVKTDRTQDHAHSANKKQISAKDLVGMDVENRAGDKIGSIDKLYLDLEGGQVLGVVVSTGGFLGMGAHQNVLALNDLDYSAGDKKLRVDMTREQLRAAPTYKQDDVSWHASLLERFKSNAERLGSSIRKSTESAASSMQTHASESPAVFKQGNSSAEKKMTADIRSAIHDSDNAATRANNVTIMTQDKKVMLRGEVGTTSEKSAIEKIARDKAGHQNVVSELVVRNR